MDDFPIQHRLTIQRVENGWVIERANASPSTTIIAKTTDELVSEVKQWVWANGMGPGGLP